MKPIGHLARDFVEAGQTYEELLKGFSIPIDDKKLKIIAWKFDEEWDAFLIKRINGIVEFYEYCNHISRLPEHELRELADLHLVNHGRSQRGFDFELKLLDAVRERKIQSDKFFFACNMADNDHHFPRKEKKKKKRPLSAKEKKEEYLEEYSRGIAFPMKLETIVHTAKVITGTQSSHPITDWTYDQADFELVLRRWKPGQQAKDIRLFSAIELKLLHPSYIMFLDSIKFKDVANKLAKEDLFHFLFFIELLATAYSMMATNKALVEQTAVPRKIKDIEGLSINNKGHLVIHNKKGEKIVITTKVELMMLSKETILKMFETPIRYEDLDMEESMRYFANCIRVCALSHQEPIPETQARQV